MPALTFDAVSKNIFSARDKTAENYRKQLAYLYRIFDYYDWCDLIVTHLSVRAPDEDALFIIPFGLSFDEVTPGNFSLVSHDARSFLQISI